MKIKTDWNQYIKIYGETPKYAQCIVIKNGEKYPEDLIIKFSNKEEKNKNIFSNTVDVSGFINLIKKNKNNFSVIDYYFKDKV